MLHHVFDHARTHGYAAVTLEVAADTPAHAFYQHEGFYAEKELTLNNHPLHHMRRDLNP